MRFKHLYQIVLVVYVCVVSADQDVSISEIDNVGIKSITKDIADNVFHQAGKGECASDADCHHLGKCQTSEGRKLCNCKSGTSGDFCEKVDECVDNPVRCGTQKDVSCVFDVVKEKAVCKCDNDSKTYVVDEERCMSPCTRYDQCGQYGYCYHEIGDQKFCACDLGTSGDYCEIIDECHNKHVDCGLEPNATCTLGGKGKAYCKCTDPKKGFDYDEKVCKDCAGCGENARSGCVYRNGIRKCNCKSKFYSSDKGICEDCKCGLDSYGCKFENDTKICQCWGGYQPNGDVCTKCDCGSEGSNCEFKDGEKICTCKEGYVKAGRYGICTQMCNASNPCENGGKCLQNLCNCLKGTSGPFCKTIDDCSKCGYADCLYNVTSREANCTCSNSKLVFDDVAKMCRVCDCGTYSRSCSYVEGKKKCKCMDAYEDRLGECTLCFCKGYSSMYGCHFEGRDMVCNCMKGYAQQGDECKRCDCGDHGRCTLSGGWGFKTCTCDKGYTEREGTCRECNCGINGRCYMVNGFKECVCEKGFIEYRGTCEACDCGANAKCEFDHLVRTKCTCNSGYGMKDGVCTACDCEPGTSCEFDNIITRNKRCFCPAGYADDEGSCKDCECGVTGANCTMTYGMFKTCICPKGYEERKLHFLDTKCIDIDECLNTNACPYSTKCVNTPGSFNCVCKEGYEEQSKLSSYDIKVDGCQDIDECWREYPLCSDYMAKCVNTPGSYRCDCPEGYYVIKGYLEKYNSCQSGTRPWRIASIVVGCASAAVIVGLLIGICNKHSSDC